MTKGKQTPTHLVETVANEEQKNQDAKDRRLTLLLLASRSRTAVEFVERVAQFGLEPELEELLELRPDWRTSVTEARERSSWDFPVDDTEEKEN